MQINLLFRHSLTLTLVCMCTLAYATPPASQPATQLQSVVGERVPSEDDQIKNLHSLGVVDGRANIFRCACPVRDLARKMTTTRPSDETTQQARARMQRLYDLGVRTVISFQSPTHGDEIKGRELVAAMVLEREAAEAVGIHYFSSPVTSSGPDSLETISDEQALQILSDRAAEIVADSKTGGVAFHCSAGHDRTGIVSAFIRMKYQHWSVDEAIAEMRRLGHNWPRYSHNGGLSSWHEEHLRGIAEKLRSDPSK